jgi:glycosyltransferase involved in cell wall biosynthesis
MLQWGMGDQGGAWQAISRAVMVNPLNREAVRIYRDLAFRLDRTGDAIRLLSEASSIWFHSRALSLNHAEMLSECGFVAEARGACEKFLAHFRVDDTLLQLAGELQSRHHDGGSDAIPGVPMVSLCMIVKDEEKNLARCLASVKAVADDIVVVDTGSGDRTVDIARAYGARVFTFPWNGDFSAARNYSLSKAAGKWILVMDADEVLSERDYAVIGGMLEQSVDRPVAWSVITRNYTDRVESEGWQANDGYYAEQEKGDGWYPSRKVRLFPNSANIRFKGDIHEMVEADLKKSGISVEPAQIVVHHYGELEETDRRAKQLRYYEMGKQKLAFRPNDAASVTELAIQAGELELYGEALELWDLLIARGEITRDIYFNRSYALMGLKRFNEASEMACKALEIDPAHKESAYNYGICLLNQAKPEQALEVIEPYNVRYPEYPLLMALRCVLCLCLNVNEQAVQLYNELIARNYAISGYVLKRVAALESMGYCALADRLRKTAAEQKIIDGSLRFLQAVPHEFQGQ